MTLTTATLILSCFLSPSPRADTADFRLMRYYYQPETVFCYKWTPKLKDRRYLWRIAKRVYGKYNF